MALALGARDRGFESLFPDHFHEDRMSKDTTAATYAARSIFFELLTVLFIGLKLAGIINWSWWWVLGPLWIPLAVGVCLGLVILVIGAIVIGIKAVIE
jgi:hypothetical protein